MKEALIIGIPFLLLGGACFCNYMRACKLEEEMESLKLRHKFVRDDLHGVIKNLENLVNILVEKNGTTR